MDHVSSPSVCTTESTPQEDTSNTNSNDYWLTIVSASYGPSDLYSASTTTTSSGQPLRSQHAHPVALTRDVTSLLKALVLHQQQRQHVQQQRHNAESSDEKKSQPPDLWKNRIRIHAMSPSGMMISQIVVLGHEENQLSMNLVFGDPCPGITKTLRASYIFTDALGVANDTSLATRAASAQIHYVNFAEHEQVVLKKRPTQQADNNSSSVVVKVAQSSTESAAVRTVTLDMFGIALPMVMPYLGLKERVDCRRVCQQWRSIIKDWGVTTIIDRSDPSFASFTRPFLRGILKHSYAGLHSLYLANFTDMTQDDFHPSLPHLHKLRSLDISCCHNLDDSTLQLIATHCYSTLNVLYMKGLRKATDEGILHICKACRNLKVIDVSNIPITDRSGVAMGQNLVRLKAIYMRDNYLLTNETFDSITQNCPDLQQLTLWGCIRLGHIDFSQVRVATKNKLIMLNLWGCHSLRDDTAEAFAGMDSLRSLVVSECHRLSDAFVTTTCRLVPWLIHFHLRYCKMVSDIGIKAISDSMTALYSLDLSFCHKPSASAISELIEKRANSLAELRLFQCQQLDILGYTMTNRNHTGADELGTSGRLILNALRKTVSYSHICLLDTRHCSQAGNVLDETLDCPFSRRMNQLSFETKLAGLFVRSARWYANSKHSLLPWIERG